MDTKEIILNLRTENGLSQEELAEKLHVTRQAVSRWETGETVPNVDTLKLLSKQFDVSINTILGMIIGLDPNYTGLVTTAITAGACFLIDFTLRRQRG